MSDIKKTINIEGKEYFVIEGYPKFGFWTDPKSQKCSIANIETRKVTEPFADKVVYSEVPLETWTANYVVVRIEDKWYLCDNNGICYFEDDGEYIICRNGFVSADKRYFINNKMEKCSYGNKIIVRESAKYEFAFRKVEDSNEYLLTSTGKDLTVYRSKAFERIHDWCMAYSNCSRLINLDFCSYFDISECGTVELIGKNSKTFICTKPNCFYSVHLGSIVSKFSEVNGFEFIEANGKTYCFKSNGEIKIIDYSISNVKCIGEYIIFRKGTSIIMCDFDFNIISKEEITLKEAYGFIVSEEIAMNTYWICNT